MENGGDGGRDVIDSDVVKFRTAAPEVTARLRRDHPSLSPLLAELLAGRGYHDPEEAERFLSPSVDDLFDPMALRDMDRAVDILRRSLELGHRILIHGDYDCDGICATTLLLDGLTELGADVDFHIPDRFEEGYGLSMMAVDRCREEGFDLLLSVDCGSSSHTEIAAAQEAGIRVIITDHHQVPDPPPTPDALVNPQHPEDTYPFKGLCGTAVAFKLLQALRQESGVEPSHLMDLVALATVADVVPLRDENRVLVHYGLGHMSRTERPGLIALLEAAGRNPHEPVDAVTVAFALAPRLNAAGRLEHARLGVELLRTSAINHARELADTLNSLNEERKECERRISLEIEARLEADPSRWKSGAIVEFSDGWHQGVIGITAGRLAEKYAVPALVIAIDGERAKGSGRSPENVDLFQALSSCAEIFSKFGGHPRAGGFSLPTDRLDDLREGFTAAANTLRRGVAPVWADAGLRLSQIDLALATQLERFEPFGEANPKPVFLLEGVTLVGHRTVGKTRDHLQLELEQGGERHRAIAFRKGPLLSVLDAQTFRYDLLCYLQRDHFRGQDRVSIQVTHIIRPAQREPDGKAIVDCRNVRHRRRELEAWLSGEESTIAVCRDVEKAMIAFPQFAQRFRSYQDVVVPDGCLVLLTPPSQPGELVQMMERCRPSRVVMLFGRPELENVRSSLLLESWGRTEAIALWREMKRQKMARFDLEGLTIRLADDLRYSRQVVSEVLEAFLETQALIHGKDGRLELAPGNGQKLETTRPFKAREEREKGLEQVLALFSGPQLRQRWETQFPWLDEMSRILVGTPS